MEAIKQQLLQVQQALQEQYETPVELIERLKQEGKSMHEIEQAILMMNRIQGAHHSVVTALKIIEEQRKKS